MYGFKLLTKLFSVKLRSFLQEADLSGWRAEKIVDIYSGGYRLY